MKKALPAVMLLVLFLAPVVSQAREPFVGSIEEEEGSLEGVTVEITSAEQVDSQAQGYDKWGIRGKNIYIEATVGSSLDKEQKFIVTFTARDVFGNVLDSCESRVRLKTGEEKPVRCVLQIKEARKLSGVTYKVTPRLSQPKAVQ
jgi:hypothetical protein